MTVACSYPRPPALWFERGQEQTRATFGASDLTAVTLMGRVARVAVVPSEDDSVRLTVGLRSTDQVRLREQCLPGARLEQRQIGGTMSLELRQSGRDRCGETWHVALPARLLVTLNFSDAEIDVTGIRGGLQARVTGTGRVRASLDSSSVFVTLGVGDVHVATRGAAVGEMIVESKAGRAELTLHGVRVPPSERSGAASRISVRGRGNQDIRLKTGVGNVSLIVD